jgi:hypothetical protein
MSSAQDLARQYKRQTSLRIDHDGLPRRRNIVAEVCALSVVPRFEVAVLNRKLVAAESAAIASNHNHVCY